MKAMTKDFILRELIATAYSQNLTHTEWVHKWKRSVSNFSAGVQREDQRRSGYSENMETHLNSSSIAIEQKTVQNRGQ